MRRMLECRSAVEVTGTGWVVASRSGVLAVIIKK
jgi:hypothetical protein